MTTSITKTRIASLSGAAIICIALASQVARAQGGYGPGYGSASGAPTSSPTGPLPSAMIKHATDRTDPLAFLLDRKKTLSFKKDVEDSLKDMRKEMKRMQENVYKEVDQAAAKKKDGEAPAPNGPLMQATMKQSIARLQEIQDAYRDRARAMLTDAQRKQADSLEKIWRETDLKKDPPLMKFPPPPR